MQRLLAKLHSEDVTVFLLTSTIRFCLLTGFAQLKLIKAEFKNQGWGWGQCIEPRGFRDGQGGFLCFDCCFTSVLVVITGSDILSSLVLCGILWWCLVFRGVGMLSITLSRSSSAEEQDWDGFHRHRLPSITSSSPWDQSDPPNGGTVGVLEGWSLHRITEAGKTLWDGIIESNL